MKTEPLIIEESLQPADKPVILIVDDSRVIRLALKKILKKEFILHEAGDGEEAWTALMENTSIQVVFSDLSMPELDGFGLLDRLRNSDDERIRKLPFIVITGNEDDEGILQEALDNGANDLITKPFQSREIKERAYAFAMTQAADLNSGSGLTDVNAEATDSISLKDQALNEEKRIAMEAEREAARMKEEEDMRRKAAEETAARIREEVEERRRKMELDEKTIELVAVKAPTIIELEPLPNATDIEAEASRKIKIAKDAARNEDIKRAEILEASIKESSVVENKIQVEVEARKNAEEELAKFKQQMEEQKENEVMAEAEKSAPEAKIEENNFQKIDMELAKYKEDPAKEEDTSIVAHDVRKVIHHNKEDDQAAAVDRRQNNEETRMIRAELKKKLQLECEQKKHNSGSFFIQIFVLLLVVINVLPGVRLDDTINDLKKRF